jgi:uncharacterized MnhB-related membrane protein
MPYYVDQTHLSSSFRTSTNVSVHMFTLLPCKTILKRQLTVRPICDTVLSALRASQLLSYEIILKRQVVAIYDAVLGATFDGQ